MTGKDNPPGFAMGLPVLKGIDICRLDRIGRRSELFVGNQVALGRDVAVKRLKADLSGSFDIREAFINAGRLAAAIVHPSAMAVINLFPEQDAIILEWCDAIPLRELEGRLSAMDAARLGALVLDGLAALHATGRAHGNLTPGNIFRDLDGGIKIDDFFQLPMLPDDPMTHLALPFIAPEVISGQSPDWRSDLYSLGRILQYVTGPDEKPGETTGVIAGFASEEPDERAENPVEASQRILKARRLEERRQGVFSPTFIRRQRQYRRIPAELSVAVKKRTATPVETGSILSRIKDIGENGVFISTEEPMPIGSIVEMRFDLVSEGGSIHAFGLVRWISQPPLTSGMGVQFVEVDSGSVELLGQYLSEQAGRE